MIRPRFLFWYVWVTGQAKSSLQVDTGSATFWVAARECNLCASSRMITSLTMGDACPAGEEQNKLYYGENKTRQGSGARG